MGDAKNKSIHKLKHCQRNGFLADSGKFNSCVHYFSIESCVHICHARDKNIKTITVGFTGLNSLRNDLKTSLPVNFRFYRILKISFSKILLHQKICREISRGVFRAIFELGPHLVVDILNFEPFVTRVINMDATDKIELKFCSSSVC